MWDTLFMFNFIFIFLIGSSNFVRNSFILPKNLIPLQIPRTWRQSKSGKGEGEREVVSGFWVDIRFLSNLLPVAVVLSICLPLRGKVKSISKQKMAKMRHEQGS